MIGTRTIQEDSAVKLFTEAAEMAFAKISESQQKLVAAAQALTTA
jgi:hypothetical protein